MKVHSRPARSAYILPKEVYAGNARTAEFLLKIGKPLFEILKPGVTIGWITGIKKPVENWILQFQQLVHVELCLTDLEKIDLYCVLTQ
ncbi:hypothetical protein [Sphingobacterium thalpophilum]|uniref:hypothetical protein n=1 Tax=Sphingobacterium thalpophilum TaxID=259 RepID=UPI003C722D9B